MPFILILLIIVEMVYKIIMLYHQKRQCLRSPTADHNPLGQRIPLNHHVMPAALLYPERGDRLNMKQQK